MPQRGTFEHKKTKIKGGITAKVVAAAILPHWTPHAVIKRLAPTVSVIVFFDTQYECEQKFIPRVYETQDK